MKSFMSYLGGKSQLAPKIVPRIPEHTCYCEVFAGAAWILFAKEESKVEIINDINGDLTTLYKVVKNHLEEFINHLKWLLISRDQFEDFKVQNPDTMTDIQRSVRFYYLIRTSYGSRLVKPTLSISALRKSNLNLLRIEESLSAAHLRLSRVYIENRPYAELIKRSDKPSTFFYIDPPYFNCENYYGDGIFSRDDFEQLRDLLRGIKGKFMMSINDVPEIRELFGEFKIEEVQTRYTLSGADKAKKVGELLITNYEIEEAKN